MKHIESYDQFLQQVAQFVSFCRGSRNLIDAVAAVVCLRNGYLRSAWKKEALDTVWNVFVSVASCLIYLYRRFR